MSYPILGDYLSMYQGYHGTLNSAHAHLNDEDVKEW